MQVKLPILVCILPNAQFLSTWLIRKLKYLEYFYPKHFDTVRFLIYASKYPKPDITDNSAE